MSTTGIIIGIVVGAAFGGVVAWLVWRLRSTVAEVKLKTRLEDLQKAQDEARQQLSYTFKSLAAEALRNNNESFLQTSKQVMERHLVQAQGDLELRKQAVEQLVKPLQERLNEIEKSRQTAYGSIEQLAKNMAEGQNSLARETRNLTSALRTPYVRGRWGELTLRRVAELAGMVEYCDFAEQETIGQEDHRKRPDMIVYLPNERLVAVDAKTPLDAYLQSIEADGEDKRKLALQQHARQVSDRVRELSAKNYWTDLKASPDFVILFIPGEPFLAAALQADPELLERALTMKIVPATPSTLIALLHAVAYGWREQRLAENAKQVQDLGKEMYERIVTWTGHLSKVGDSLEKAVNSYNESIGSLEHRVLSSARRFKELGVSTGKDIPETAAIDRTPRKLDVPTEKVPDGKEEAR